MSTNIGWIDLDTCRFHVRAGYSCRQWIDARAKVGDTELRCGCCKRDLMTEPVDRVALVITNNHGGMPNFVVGSCCVQAHSHPEVWISALLDACRDFEQFKSAVKDSPWKSVAEHL